MKILYIGCVQSSYILLESLLKEGAGIVGVITKRQSKFNADFVDIIPLCQKYDIKYHYVENINEQSTMEFVDQIKPEIAFCFGWSELINKDLISKFSKGIIGFHPAALPYNKGRHPIIWALALGLKKTASTFFKIEEEADSGDIVSQEEVIIEYTDDASTLYNKIMNKAQKQVVSMWKDLENNEVHCVPQKKGIGNTWRKRNQRDGHIDWRMSSYGIYNLVRSLTKPYIGAHFIFQDKEIKVWKVEEIITDKYDNIEPGKILAIYDNGEIDVKAGENVIRLKQFDTINISVGQYL